MALIYLDSLKKFNNLKYYLENFQQLTLTAI
jgi:hypothetical protein